MIFSYFYTAVICSILKYARAANKYGIHISQSQK